MHQRETDEEQGAQLASQLNAPGFDGMESIVQIDASDGSLVGVLIPEDILEQYRLVVNAEKHAVIFLKVCRGCTSFQVSILPDGCET